MGVRLQGCRKGYVGFKFYAGFKVIGLGLQAYIGIGDRHVPLGPFKAAEGIDVYGSSLGVGLTGPGLRA